MRLFLHRVQRQALDTVRRRCRFRGPAYQACLYIATQLLADKKVDLDLLNTGVGETEILPGLRQRDPAGLPRRLLPAIPADLRRRPLV